jgi:hypothetical protein
VFSDIPEAELGNKSQVKIRRNMLENHPVRNGVLLGQFFGAENDGDYHSILSVRVFLMRGQETEPLEGFDIANPKRFRITPAAVDERTPEGSFEFIVVRGDDFTRLTGADLAAGSRFSPN